MSFFFRSGLERWSVTREHVIEAGFTVTNKTQFDDNDVVINWGGTTPLQGGHILNPPESVVNCSDKVRSLEILSEYVPPYWTEYSTDIPAPFVMKKNHTHKGFGKRKVNRHRRSKIQTYQQYDWFQEFINIQHEYRVLTFFNGKRYTIPRIYLKHPTGERSPRPTFHPVWEFQKQVISEVDERIRTMCLDAIRKLEMHLVGFDVAITTDNHVYIIEANSAPGLGVGTASKLYRRLSENYGTPA